MDEEKHAENDVLGEENHAKGKGNGDKERNDEDGDEKEKRSKENHVMPVLSVNKQEIVGPVSRPKLSKVDDNCVMMETCEANEKGDGDDDEKKDDEKRTVENPIMPVMSVDKQDSVEPVSSPGVQSVQTSKKIHNNNTYISYAAAVSGGGECTSGEESTGT